MASLLRGVYTACGPMDQIPDVRDLCSKTKRARRRRLVYRGGPPGRIADSESRRDRDPPSTTPQRRLVDSKIDAAPPPIAAPINAPFLPPMMAPTPAPDAADPPMTMAVFFQVRCGGASSPTRTASRW